MSITHQELTNEELAREREVLGMDPAEGGTSVAQRAERAFDPVTDPDPDDEAATEEEDLFVLEEQGRRVSLGELWDRGTPIHYKVNLRSKSISGGRDMGLLRFGDPDLLLVVPARQGKVEVDPSYTEDGEVKHVEIRANFKPLALHDAASSEGLALLGLEDKPGKLYTRSEVEDIMTHCGVPASSTRGQELLGGE